MLDETDQQCAFHPGTEAFKALTLPAGNLPLCIKCLRELNEEIALAIMNEYE